MPCSTHTDLQRFLDCLTRRSVLTEEARQAILDLPTRAEQVRAHEDFVSLGEKVDHTCLVVAGLVGRYGQNAEGDRQITAIHVPGDMADLHSVVQPGPVRHSKPCLSQQSCASRTSHCERYPGAILLSRKHCGEIAWWTLLSCLSG